MPPQKPKVKVKTEKGVPVKKEKVAVKKEIADGASRTGVRTSIKTWDQKAHYRHQVGFLDEVLKPPWKLCFGALGTGIIGIQPETTSSSKSSSSKSSSSASRVKTEPAEESEVPSRIPADATVALLLNAPGLGAQGRNGNVMGGYGDVVDVKTKTLHWKSQRSDCKSTKIGAIVAHCRKGGRIVVGVRGTSLSSRFSLLGIVSSIDKVEEVKFLIEDGAFVICDGAKIHKTIGPACLDVGLKSGIGLVTKRYPLSEKNGKDYTFCKACCYAEPHARLHFDELSKEGLAEYGLGSTRFLKKLEAERAKVKVERKVKQERSMDESPPRTRLRFKQEAPDWAPVKKEREDSSDRKPRKVTRFAIDLPKKKPAAEKKVLGKMQKKSAQKKLGSKAQAASGSGSKSPVPKGGAKSTTRSEPSKVAVKKEPLTGSAPVGQQPLRFATKVEPVAKETLQGVFPKKVSSEDCRVLFALAHAPPSKSETLGIQVVDVEDCTMVSPSPEVIGIDVE